MRERCEKCGGTDIFTRWHENRRSCPYASKAKRDDEHLHYHCRTCQYDWTGDIAVVPVSVSADKTTSQ